MKRATGKKLRSAIGAAPRSIKFGIAFLITGLVALSAAVYLFWVFTTLEDPFTHAFPVTFDYFGYVSYYQQTQADYTLLFGLGAGLIILCCVSFVSGYLASVPALAPLGRLSRRLSSAPARLKSTALAIPLVLLEVGLAVYGAVLALSSSNLGLSLDIRENPVARVLFMGPVSAIYGGGSRAEQDYYYLVLFAVVLAAAWYRYGSVRRVLQVGSLAIMPLPVLIYLFDGVEFGTFFASEAEKVGLGWFSNEVLLYLSIAVFVVATSYPWLRKRSAKTARHPGDGQPMRRALMVGDEKE
jgi:hypothetical protein